MVKDINDKLVIGLQRLDRLIYRNSLQHRHQLVVGASIHLSL